MRHVLLVGAGHAHIELIRRWAESPLPGCSLSVVDPNLRPVYSGMVPGFVAGQYRREELEIDLAPLCERAGAELLADEVVAIDAKPRRMMLSSGRSVEYDFASLDIGSTVAGRDLPGVSDVALASRPIPGLIDGIDRLIADARDASAPFEAHVVGGGAAGVELAFCLDARLRGEGVADAGVHILTAEQALFASAPPRLRRKLSRAALRRGLSVVAESEVSSLAAGAIRLADGRELATHAVLWAAGPASHPLASRSGLPVDAGGFVRVADTLQVQGQPELFAVGDCASLAGMKKAGVYAVRAGPLLDDNLRAALEGGRLRRFVPQRDFLSLLNLGDGSAVGAKWGFAFEGRWVMRLKDRIDRAFMDKYS